MAPTIIDHDGGPLLVFEPEDDYRRENAIEGYWGAVTSSIDWCERNYVVSHLVAEWYNTLSNSCFILIGLWGAHTAWRNGIEFRYVVTYLNVATIGIGSAAFHGTLTHVGQQGDETPMVFSAACWLVVVCFQDPAFEARHPGLFGRCAWAATALCTVFACTHYVYRFTTGFQLLFASMLTCSLPMVVQQWRQCTNPAALRFGRGYYLATIFSALALWLCDQHFCVHLHALPGGLPNPHFHAWWHGLMGVHGYLGPTFMVYQRLEYLGRKPRLRYALGVLPYVVPGAE